MLKLDIVGLVNPWLQNRKTPTESQ